MVTISTHNGTQVARQHNLRNPKIVGKEEHIRPDGEYEIWHDESLHDAYNRIFGEAVQRYNERQKRADRKIKNYLAQVEQDARKKPVYEMIIGVYGEDCNVLTKKEILKEFTDSWKERNPNLEMVGAYYHYDEQGTDPHVHIDYIPVAHGYKNGMDTQNGLTKALEEQGIVGFSASVTHQILWEKQENMFLEMLCEERGLTVEHPGKGEKHLDTAEYKALKNEITCLRNEKKNLEQVLAETKDNLVFFKEQHEALEDKYEAFMKAEEGMGLEDLKQLQSEAEELKNEVKDIPAGLKGISKIKNIFEKFKDFPSRFSQGVAGAIQHLHKLQKQKEELQQDLDELRPKLEKEINARKEYERDLDDNKYENSIAQEFLKQIGFWDIFSNYLWESKVRDCRVWSPDSDKKRKYESPDGGANSLNSRNQGEVER